jgi:four helix bundle protein
MRAFSSASQKRYDVLNPPVGWRPHVGARSVKLDFFEIEGAFEMLKGHRDLKVYQLAYALAMEIFNLSKSFPREERYSLTDQIRRSSRSVAANIAEGFRKRRYPNHFLSKLTDSDAEATETQVWIDFAFDCGYLSKENQDHLTSGYEEVGKMLGGMMAIPDKFALK